jgi:hypothetical protein
MDRASFELIGNVGKLEIPTAPFAGRVSAGAVGAAVLRLNGIVTGNESVPLVPVTVTV